MTAPTVDVAGHDDVDVVRELRLAALADAPDAFWSTTADEVDQLPGWWRSRVVDQATWLLARLAGTPAGLAAIGDDHRQRPGVRGLLSVWVAPQARRHGVGDALLEAAVRVARGQGVRMLALDVGDHNRAAARLYARHGFAPTGHIGRFLPPREHITEHELAREL